MDRLAERQTDGQMDELADGLADNIVSLRGLENSPRCFLIKSMGFRGIKHTIAKLISNMIVSHVQDY